MVELQLSQLMKLVKLCSKESRLGTREDNNLVILFFILISFGVNQAI
jgi:hypothetical protein